MQSSRNQDKIIMSARVRGSSAAPPTLNQTLNSIKLNEIRQKVFFGFQSFSQVTKGCKQMVQRHHEIAKKIQDQNKRIQQEVNQIYIQFFKRQKDVIVSKLNFYKSQNLSLQRKNYELQQKNKEIQSQLAQIQLMKQKEREQNIKAFINQLKEQDEKHKEQQQQIKKSYQKEVAHLQQRFKKLKSEEKLLKQEIRGNQQEIQCLKEQIKQKVDQSDLLEIRSLLSDMVDKVQIQDLKAKNQSQRQKGSKLLKEYKNLKLKIKNMEERANALDQQAKNKADSSLNQSFGSN